MVTQATSMSGNLRKVIGGAKSRIRHLMSQKLPDRENLEQFSADSLAEVIEDYAEDYERLHLQVHNLKSYETQWRSMRQENLQEQNVHAEYIKEYGDYMPTLRNGESHLLTLQELYRFAYERLQSLDEKRASATLTADELKEIHDNQKAENMSQDAHFKDSKHEQHVSFGLNAAESTNKVPEQTTLPDQRTSQVQMAIPDNRTPQQMAIPDERTPHQSPSHSTPVTVQSTSVTTLSTVYPPVQQHVQCSHNHLGLTPIELPTFNGDYLSYYEFRQSFDSIMNGVAADNFTRLHRLKASLSGEPLDLIRTLSTTAANYPIAIQQLDDFYGGHLRITNLLLEELRDLPDISTTTDAVSLQKFVCKANLVFNQLLSFGCEMDNISTATMIQHKLPKRVIAKIYGQSYTDTPCSASELIRKIQEISRSENLVAAIYNKKPDGQRHATTMATVAHNNNRTHQKANNVGHVSHSQSRPKVDKPCAFCVEDRMRHLEIDCRKHPTVAVRRERAKELRLCFRCLKTGHAARQCRENCTSCNGRHHDSLCHHREATANQPIGGYGNQNQNKNQGPIRTNAPQPLMQATTAYAPPAGIAGGWTPRYGTQPSFNPQYGNGQGPPRNQQRYGQSSASNGYNRGHATQIYCVEAAEETTVVTYAAQDEVEIESDTDASNGYNSGHATQTCCVEAAEETIAFTNAAQYEVEPESDTENCLNENTDIDLPDTKTSSTEDAEVVKTLQMNDTKQQKQQPVIMQIVDLPILDKDGNEHVEKVFLNSGSNTSFIAEPFNSRLQLTPTERKPLNLSRLADPNKKNVLEKKVIINIKTNQSVEAVELDELPPFIAENMCTPEVQPEILTQLLKRPQSPWIREYKEIDILIGLDCKSKILGKLETTQLSNGLEIADCGPIISGREIFNDSSGAPVAASDATILPVVNQNPGVEKQQQMMIQFVKLESIGMVDNESITKTENETSEHLLTLTIRNRDGRIRCRLPNENKNDIPANRQFALHGLQETCNWLEKINRTKEPDKDHGKPYQIPDVHTAIFIKQVKTNDKKQRNGFTYTSVVQAGVPTRRLIGEFQGAVENYRIISKLTTNSLVAIQVQFWNQSIQRVEKQDDCTITDTRISGCFSCGKGAQLKGVCHSKVNERIKATVQCPSIGTDFVECKKNGTEVNFNFNAAFKDINETCKIQCGTRTRTFEIQGSLDEIFTFDAKQLQEKFVIYSEYLSSDNAWTSIKDTVAVQISGIWNSLTQWIGTWVIIGMVIIGIMVGLQFYFAFSFPFLARECRNSSPKVSNLQYRRRNRRALKRNSNKTL